MCKDGIHVEYNAFSCLLLRALLESSLDEKSGCSVNLNTYLTSNSGNDYLFFLLFIGFRIASVLLSYNDSYSFKKTAGVQCDPLLIIWEHKKV